MNAEHVIVLALFFGGAALGLLSRHAPMSGWAALALPLALPGLGLVLAETIC